MTTSPTPSIAAIEPTASPAFRVIVALAGALAVLALQPSRGDGGALAMLAGVLAPLATAAIVHRYATTLLTLVAIFLPVVLFAVALVGLLVR